MKQTTIVIILLCFLISCDKESVKTPFLASTNSLKYVIINDTILLNFFIKYIARNSESKGVFIVHTSSDFMERKQYTIVKRIADYNTDRIAPLTFTRISGIPVFFYSGIDNLFPSTKRYQHYLDLSKNYFNDRGIYCGIPGEIVFCGSKVDRIDYQLSIQSDDYTSCVKEADSVMFLPPKVSEDSIEQN